MRTLVLKNFRDLRAQKWQFLAVTFLVFLGVSLFTGLYSSYLNIKATYEKFYSETNFEDFGLFVNPAPKRLLEKIRRIHGVEAVVGRITAYGTVEVGGKEIMVKLVSIPRENSKVNSIYIVEGVYPKGNEALILKKFSDRYGISIGEKLNLRVGNRTYTLRVSGTACSPEYVLIWDMSKRSGVLFVPYNVMEKITGLKGKVTEVHVKVYSDVDEVMSKVENIFKPYGIKKAYKKKDQPGYKLLRMDLKGFEHTALMFPSMLIIIAALATYVMLSRVVMGQMNVIAVLRAIGYSKTDVILHYLTYPVLIGVVGTVAGIFAGYWISSAMTSSYVDVLNLPYYVSKIYPNVTLVSVSIGMLAPIIAGSFTVKSVAEVEPAVAMKGIAVERTIGVKFERFSIMTRMAIKNVLRNPKRTVYTVLGLAMGVVLVGTSLALIDSVNEMMHVQFDKINGYDFKVECSNVKGIRALNDVKEAYPIVETWIVFERNGITEESTLIGLPVQDLYNIYDLKGRRHFPPPKGIILPEYLAKKLGVSKGEVIKAFTKVGVVRFEVYDIFPQPLFPACYANIDQLERMGFKPNYVIVKGGNENELKRFGRVTSIKDVRKDVEEMMSMMNEFFAFSVLFGVTLASAMIFNTVTINIMERRREIATLRMLGYTVREIGESILIETFILGFFGILLGFPMVLGVLKFFETTYEGEIFKMPFVIYPQTYALTTAIIIATVLLSLLPGMRYISRMKIEKVTKEVTG